MIEQLLVKVRQSFPFFIVLLLLCSPFVDAQAPSSSENAGKTSSEALKFLKQVLERYDHATTYHFETVEEHEISGPFRRSWDRVVNTAIVAPHNLYHFEVRAEETWFVQVSDGHTEWLYQPELHQYLQTPAPNTGPIQPRQKKIQGAFQLENAQNTRKRLVDMQKLFLSAAFLPNEDLEVNGQRVTCRVVAAPRKELPGLSPNIVSQFTFWVDEKAGLIRKITEHTEGPLRTNHPEDHYVNTRTVVFNLAEIDLVFDPNQLFTFTPPQDAALVRDFDSDPLMVRLHGFVGSPVPMIELRSADGSAIALKSFSGQAVLLDFWATWCAPCVDSLPSLEKLHQETAPKGLVLISIDEDLDPKKAADLWAKRGESWPNFHATAEILKQFPEHGIPYLVLIDGSGNVVFSDEGLNVDRLRAAIARVSPAFASLSRTIAP